MLLDRFQTRRVIVIATVAWGAFQALAAGAIIIAGLIGWFDSWRIAFVIAGIGTMRAGVLAWKYIRNHPSEHPGVNAAELARIFSGADLLRGHGDAAGDILQPDRLSGTRSGMKGAEGR
jgi:MFS family permease